MKEDEVVRFDRSIPRRVEEAEIRPTWETWADLERSDIWVGRPALQPPVVIDPVHVMDLGHHEKLDRLLDEVKGLRKVVSTLDKKVVHLESLLVRTQKLVLSISQAYYWTPEWQAREARADQDSRLGRSKRFSSADDLIKELNE